MRKVYILALPNALNSEKIQILRKMGENMNSDKVLVVFQGNNIRRLWHKGEWYFSVIDVVEALTDSGNPRNYWNMLKSRESEHGIELYTYCVQLKLPSQDDKMRLTDCANTKSLFRVVQSIPSRKAEPFKLWLAQVGYERVEEIQNPELAQERMKQLYEQKGYSKSWIDKRLRGMAVRQDLTDEWGKRGAKTRKDYSILTAEISKATFDMTPGEYKNFKGLKHQNLRDHMDDIELILTMLGEATTTRFTRERDSKQFPHLQEDAKDGGDIAGDTRKNIEKKLGKSVVSEDNYLKAPEKRKRLEK